MARVSHITQTTDCSCGRTVVAVPGLDPMVCPHVPQPALAVSTTRGESSSPLPATIRALEQALDWLTRPCTACTCRRVVVGDLDPDPDCPGLSRDGDGCRADGRIRAWAALQAVGLRYSAQSLRVEQLAIGLALQHAHDVLANPDARDAVTAAATVEVIRAPVHRERVDVVAMRDAGATWQQIADAVGWASPGSAWTNYHRRVTARGNTNLERCTSPAGAGRCTA